MIIENERYRVISRGADRPEPLPEAGRSFTLMVEPTTGVPAAALEAIVAPDYVEKLGESVQHAWVHGKARVLGEVLPCPVHFMISPPRERGQLLGELVLKRMIEDVSER